ncbi:hypothetical protein EI94DRAFT_1712450 [Lactarius quietus]|nr:hypothetical protein EI94DRAFT_1712450 [Lactarius quietus]
MSLPAIVSLSPDHVGNAAPSSVYRKFLKFLLDIPPRFLTRLRSLDRLLDREAESNQAISFLLSYGTDPGAPAAHMATPPPSTFPHYPGPWSFFASGYAVSLFAMALLLNRIQNIVVPSRQPQLHHTRSAHDLQGRWVFRMILPSIFPMDLSSTYSRTVLRLPSMYYISKSLVLWSILALQASDCLSSTHWKPLRLLDNWAARKEMDEICWSTFLAICGALCIGALTRGLEGVGATNAAPFNLFGYSFMLHFYASPLTHLVKPEGLPSRPDVNVIFTLFVPLFQLSMIHFIGVKQSWSNQRLIPTTICSMLTLIHFHSVLWFSPTSYPLLNYVSCIFDSMLILVILVAFSLNILTQLLLEGSVTRLFVGHTAALMPKWDEDFSSVLLRLGIASLDATSVAGLGNEVSGISLTEHSEAVKYQVQYGEVEMNRAGVSSITHATEGHEGRRTRMEGFSNEIRRVRVGPSLPNDPLLDTTWFMECKRFGYAVARFGLGCGRMIGRLLRGQPVFLQPLAPYSGQNQRVDVQLASASQENETEDTASAQQDIYERFLSGEVLSDDDEEFSISSNLVPQYDDDNDGMGSDTSDDEVDTLALYTDLSTTASSSATAPLLLAHMTDASPSPLTRRRYRNLVSGQRDVAGHEKSAWEAFTDGKSGKVSRQGPPNNEPRRNCVICTVEERQIICWPCRCLALCDDCRQNLASRLSASKHTCPCCRQPVEGFSRIYIP